MTPSFLLVPSLILVFGFSMAQNGSAPHVFQQYDQLVSLENTGLYNGTEFNDIFLNTDGTYRYFKRFDYNRGSVVYSGQFYPNIPLKYDLLEDNLLTHSDDNLSIFVVKLIPEFIDSFTVHNREFVRLTNVDKAFVGNGFFEKVFIGNKVKLYTKHVKKKRDKALQSGIQYRFSDANFFLIAYKNQYFIANSAKDVWKNIPELKDQIRKFSKTYKQLYKTDKQAFMTKLIGYLDSL